MTSSGQPTARYVSDRPIPVAGFNWENTNGDRASAGKVTVETYATQGVERGFPLRQSRWSRQSIGSHCTRATMIVPPAISGAKRGKVAEAAAQAIQYYADRFGPYPYSHLP